MPETTAPARLKPVLEQAAQEAVRRGDRRIGTDHLLLALLRDEEAPPARALGVTLAEGHAALESLDRAALGSVGIHLDELPTPPDADRPVRGRRHVGLNSAARTAIVAAKHEAERERRGRRIEPRHLLLALLTARHPDPAADLLTALGLSPATIRTRLTAP
jgi:ATP-dependent Clp protease ATP-binding subunit ClpA